MVISLITITSLFAATSRDLDYNIVSSGTGYGVQGSQFVIELQMKATTTQAELGSGQMRITFNSGAMTLNTGASSINSDIVNYDPGLGLVYSNAHVYSPATGKVQAGIAYVGTDNPLSSYDIPTGSWLDFAHVVFDITDPSQTSQIAWIETTPETQFYAEDNTTSHTNNSFAGNVNITLPVELSTFTIEYLNNMAVLYWVTQSETDNIGWNVYRNTEEEFQSVTQINNDLIEGYGTTTEPHSYIYVDEIENAMPGDTYWYWLESIDLGGQSHIYQIASSITIPDPNDPGYNVEVPVLYNVINAPNPFNSYTKIHFTLSEPAIVEVSIYNILGKLVRTLPRDVAVQDGQAYKGTSYWNGRDNNGTDLPAGIYLYQLEVNSKPYTTKKLILMR